MLRKKRILSVLFVLLFVLIAVASGESTDTKGSNDEGDQVESQAVSQKEDNGEKVYLDEEEIQYIYSDPRKYKGKHVIITGKVFVEPERNGDEVAVQMFQKPTNSENNTLIMYKGNIDIEDGDYIRVDGVIEGEFKGTNAFGGTITTPKILANELEVLSYIEVMAPTEKELIIGEKQDQYGYEVIIDKIELSEPETRVYITINNNGGSNFSAYSFNAKLLQGKNQFEAESNWEADYPEIQSDLRPGASTSGIICFPAIDHSESFTLYIDGYSDNWEEDFKEYEFEVEIN
ncbi:MAG: hypothetical protein ACOYJ1_14890 [Peptococcales bacterium]|jgi:hypothetical protein